MTDLIDTTEMYLRTILELEEEGIVPMRARIAERLEHSGPTVSQTVARMEKHGLLTVEPDRHLELTEEGRHKAVEVMRSTAWLSGYSPTLLVWNLSTCTKKHAAGSTS